MRSGVKWAVAAAGLVLILECTGAPILVVLFHLAVGWVEFLARVAPNVQVRWDVVGSAAVYAVMLIVGAHCFVRWVWREMRKDAGAGPWRWRWTMAGSAIVTLMFAAGTAAIGIVHQGAWLARSPEPWFRYVSRANTRCASNLRQIGQGILLYCNDHGKRYPDDLSVLIPETDLSPEVFVCPAGNDESAPGQTPREQAGNLLKSGHCSYIYLGKGLCEPVDADRVIALEPLRNHDGEGINALFGDGHVEWFGRAAARKLLDEMGLDERGERKAGATTRGADGAGERGG